MWSALLDFGVLKSPQILKLNISKCVSLFMTKHNKLKNLKTCFVLFSKQWKSFFFGNVVFTEVAVVTNLLKTTTHYRSQKGSLNATALRFLENPLRVFLRSDRTPCCSVSFRASKCTGRKLSRCSFRCLTRKSCCRLSPSV